MAIPYKHATPEELLLEATRAALISQSRSAGEYRDKSHGKNRFERKRLSKIAGTVKSYNQINMNNLFKQDELVVVIPVVGETDTYEVSVRFNGVVTELAKNIKNNKNVLEFKLVVQALTKLFNAGDVFVKCTCLDGDTKIKLLDGTTPTVEELLARYESGEKLFVYSTDEQGDFHPGEIEKVWITGNRKDFVKVTLDNGEEIITTPDHQYMLRTGEYCQARDLTTGISLMPLYFDKTKNGYDTVKFNSTGKYHSVYKIVGNEYYSDEIAQKTEQAQKERKLGLDKMSYDIAIHHKDFNKYNNNPDNLQIMTGYEHWLYHANTIQRLWENEEFRAKTSERSREWMTWLNQHPTDAMTAARKSEQNIKTLTAHNSDPVWLEKQSKLMTDLMTDYWTNLTEAEYKERCEFSSKISKEAWARDCFDTEAFRTARQLAGMLLQSPEVKLKTKQGIKNYWANITEERREAVKQRNAKSAFARRGKYKGRKLTDEDKQKKSCAALNMDPEVRAHQILVSRDAKILKIFQKLIEDKKELTFENYEEYRKLYFTHSPRITKYFNNIEEAVQYYRLNHKVVKVAFFSTEEKPVYDIKVKKYHNFLVNAGVILHNCDDYKYRFKHWNILKNVDTDGTDKDPGPGKGIRNPKDSKGRGCKHVLLVLANMDWIMKVASTIHNYIKWAAEKLPKPFMNVIFPKLYGIPGDEAVEAGLVEKEEDLKSTKELIDKINAWSKTKGLKQNKGKAAPEPEDEKPEPAKKLDGKKDETEEKK